MWYPASTFEVPGRRAVQCITHSSRLTNLLVLPHLPYARGHLIVRVDSEALVLRHARQLHVLCVQLLLHDLLQRLEHHLLRLGQCERLVIFVLQLCLCTLASRSDGLGVIAVKGARRLSVVSVSSSSVTSYDTSSTSLVKLTGLARPRHIQRLTAPLQMAYS